MCFVESASKKWHVEHSSLWLSPKMAKCSHLAKVPHGLIFTLNETSLTLELRINMVVMNTCAQNSDDIKSSFSIFHIHTLLFYKSFWHIHLFLLLYVDRLIGLPEGRARNHNRPQQVPALAGIHILDIAVGAEHTLVLSSTGDVYTWGSNSEGQVTCCYTHWTPSEAVSQSV